MPCEIYLMKKTTTILILTAIVISFSGALYYLYQKNNESPEQFLTEKPSLQTIVKKTIATGSILPLEEVLIKPNISGVIEKIYVKGGDRVKTGDLIAQIKVVPNLSALNDAKDNIAAAQIAVSDQSRNFERQERLFEKKVISAADFQVAEIALKQANQRLTAAQKRYDIIKTGTTKGLGAAANTLIRATVSGMVLEVPVEVGNQVIESNTFNEGTTIAAIADVNEMIFEGKIDESEVGKISEGLPLEITVGALEDEKFEGRLDYIAPKGKKENGAIQFEIEGKLSLAPGVFIRAGLSANAAIILEKATSVLAIKESLLQFDKQTNAPFVEVAVGEQDFERRDLVLGVSDGIYVAVLSGIDEQADIKIWNAVSESNTEN